MNGKALVNQETFCFEADEIYMDRKLEGMTQRQLLARKTGLFKVSEVEKVLGIPPGSLRAVALKVAQSDESPYRKWGIGNSKISHWVVRIKVFAKHWEKEIKPVIDQMNRTLLTIPNKVTPEELCGLEGIIRLSELKGKFPFHQQSIKNQVRKLGEESRQEMGCWKEKNHFYVDLQPFLSWINRHRYQ